MTDRSKHRELYPSTPWAPSRPSSDIQRSWVPARLFPPPATVWGWRWSWLCWGPRKLPSLAPSCWSGIWPWHSASSPSRLGYQTRIRVSSKQENVKSQIFSSIFFYFFRTESFHGVSVLLVRPQEVRPGENDRGSKLTDRHVKHTVAFLAIRSGVAAVPKTEKIYYKFYSEYFLFVYINAFPHTLTPSLSFTIIEQQEQQ